MPNILTDITTALKLTGDVRRARKAGADAVKVQPIFEIPVFDFGYWSWTMEACLYYGKEFKVVGEVFKTFPKEIQHRLTFAPKAGEWGNRVRLWQDAMRPVLEPELYHIAIIKLIRWGIHCRKMELGIEGATA